MCVNIIKFMANPDKFIFIIGVAVLGFLFLFICILLNHLILLLPLLILWILFSIYLVKRNYIVYIIHDDKFIIHYMSKEYEINFDEIVYILEISNYTNTLQEKQYKLSLNDKLNIDDKLLKIVNKTFTKWIKSNYDKFRILKQNIFD